MSGNGYCARTKTVPGVGTAFFDYALVTHIPPCPEQAPNPTYFHKRNVETPYRSLRRRQVDGALGWADRSLNKKRSVHVWNPH
jgi:hypothetical protein